MTPGTDSRRNAIAIVGISCRFPEANSPNEFWNLLINKRHTVKEIPRDRWNADALFDPDPLAERKTHQRQASLLSNVHDFDPLFFNISPAEATEMSPSQKLMLELAWEAIESSSIPYRNIQGGNVSVFVGNIWSDFEHYRKFKNARPTLHSAVGMSSPVVANRVSFALGLKGASLVVDTGCSASLVALHLACQNLISGESAMSIVGGINHILDPDKYIELTKFGGLSHKHRCSSFDKDADGFVRGEGGGVILLKRLDEAERDGDRIYAVIRGTAVNNNGFNDTLPATSTEGQIALLESAYSAAGIAPAEVHYVEAHGTGTKLGDPNEAKAIGQFFRKDRKQPLRIGSVKTNIGHTEATAGIAGLIKVVLAMQHQALPPNLNFNTPNPDIPFDELMLEVQDEQSAWPAKAGETFKAGVNSFGWGGTNAHAVLEQYPALVQEDDVALEELVLPLSAKSPAALKAYARDYANLLTSLDDKDAASVCVATALVKAEFDHRHVFFAENRNELIEKLIAFADAEEDVTPATLTGTPKVVFIFPGQGAQWLGMGRELFEHNKIFRESINACDAAFQPYTDWSLLGELNASPESSRLNEINVIQPALFAMQVSLAKVWMSWGISPDAVVGHSMGEVAAAYISGALSLDDAARIICSRSRLMKTVAGTGGAMAVTELSREDAEKTAARFPGKLSVAVNNSPKSTVLAGDKAAIDEVLSDLEAKGLFCRLVKVDVASHSPQMDPLMEPLRSDISGLRARSGDTKFYSTVRAELVAGELLDESYWVDNLRGTVQFAAVMQMLMDEGHTVFLECNPHPVLVTAVNECATAAGKRVITACSTLREKDELSEMQRNLCELYVKGYSWNWGAFFGTNKIPHIDLPGYPFQRDRYEIEDLSAELAGRVTIEHEVGFPLLGNRLVLAGSDNIFYWDSQLSLQRFPFLKDHLVNGEVRVPTACYMEIMLEAISEAFRGEKQMRIRDVSFGPQLLLSERARVDIQVKVVLLGRFSADVTVYQKDNATNTWNALAGGKADIFETVQVSDTTRIFEELEYQSPAYTEGINYYNLLRTIGFDFGKHFNHLTGIDKVDRDNANKILFSIRPDDHVVRVADRYCIHPALLSSFFQPILGQLMNILEEGTQMKVELNCVTDFTMEGQVNYDHEIRGLMVMHEMKKATDVSGAWRFRTDIIIANYDNTPVMTIRGLEGSARRMAMSSAVAQTNGAVAGADAFKAAKTDQERLKVLHEIISRHVGGIVKMPVAQIRPTMTFKGMGLDSLMAVQLRNHLEKDFEVKVPVGMFWAHPTIRDYSEYLLGLLAGAGSAQTIQMTVRDHAKWFTVAQPRPLAMLRLFLFHDAGGSAALFDGWDHYFENDLIEVVRVELPGRGQRLNEPPYTDTAALLDDLVPAILPLLDKPYVFLGHSMGGLIAFEIMHELRKKGNALPEMLFISSTSGLNAYEKSQVDYTVSDAELVTLYPHLDLSVIGDRELQQMLISILRADLQLLHSHQYRFEVPFNVPIIAIHGDDDQRVNRYQIEQWEKETFTSFRLVSRPGGHRYIEHDAEFVAGLIEEEAMQLSLALLNGHAVRKGELS